LPFLQEEGEKEKAKTPSVGSPGITIQNPSAYGAAWGNVGIGIGLKEWARFSDFKDELFGMGFGVGNPQKNVALQIGISLVDPSPMVASVGNYIDNYRKISILLSDNRVLLPGGDQTGGLLYMVSSQNALFSNQI